MGNIATIKAGPRTIEILHPATKQPIGIRVPLVSLDDPKMAAIRRSIADRRMYLEQRGKHIKAEEIEENNFNVFANAMLGWDWYNPTGVEGDEGYDVDAMPDFNGEVPDFTKRNVLNVMRELPWFRDQIDEALGDETSFFTDSKRN